MHNYIHLLHRSILCICFLAGALLWQSCAGMSSIQGGYRAPYRGDLQEGHRGARLEAHFGGGVSSDAASVGADASLNVNGAAKEGSAGLGLGIFAFTNPGRAGFLGRANIRLFELGSYEGRFTSGMGSPAAEFGMYIVPGPMTGLGSEIVLLVTASTGYDFRFSPDTSNAGWWSIQIGVGVIQKQWLR